MGVRVAAGSGTSRLVSNTGMGVDDPNRFGNRVREARERKGWSQIQLGQATGYSNGWISSVERGTAVPTSTCARRIEIALGVDLGVTDLVRDSSKRRGSVGDWGMTATEVAGYAGLSRTRIYSLMRNYGIYRDRSDGLTDVDAGEGVDWDTMLPWKDVEGFRRISIRDCATWIVTDMVRHADDAWRGQVYELLGFVNLVDKEEKRIKEWLKNRRSSL